MQIVIDIHETDYQSILNRGNVPYSVVYAIMNGTPLPKGNGNKYEAKAITRGNCMMCGQELTEGLFFCKECEDKGKEWCRMTFEDKAGVVISQLRADRDRLQTILDEIKAEIKHFMYEINPSSSESDYACNYILDIIDKYKAESEVKE